jgi:ferredoxin
MTKALYDSFPLEDKNLALAGYLYLKYTRHFYYYALKLQGIDAEPPEDKIDESIEEMLQMLCQNIGDAAMSYDTSLYHAKVMKKEDARKLLTLKENINITPTEKVMPFKIARQLLIENPGSIAAAPCICRMYSKEPCYPRDKDICLFVGDPQASFMAEQNPIAHKISQDEALQVLEIAHEHGFVHCAYFEKAVGERLNVICNCCSCCCGGMKAWNMTEGAVPILSPSGYLARINEECSGCGDCVDACQFNAIGLDEDNGIAVVHQLKCMGCGICVDVCANEAMTLERSLSKGDPLDIDEMRIGMSTKPRPD